MRGRLLQISELHLLGALVLLMASAAAHAQTVTLTQLRYQTVFATISIPRLDITGSPLSEAELRAILDPASPGSAAERISRIEARSAVAPEIVVAQEFSGGSGTATYLDVRITDIARGVFGEISATGMIGENVDPQTGKVSYRTGPAKVEALDMALLLRVLFDSSSNPQAVPVAPLYRSVSYSDYTMQLPSSLGEVAVGRVTSRDFRARVGRESFDKSFRALLEFADRQQNARPNATPGAQDLVSMGNFLEMFANFETGVTDAENIRMRMLDGDARTTVSIAAMRFSDQPANSGFALRDLRVEAGAQAGTVSVTEIEARDFSFREAFAAASDLLRSGDPGAIERQWMRLIPKLGSMRIAGIDMTVPDPDARPRRPHQRQEGPRRQEPAQTLRITAKSVDLGFGNQIEGVPTAFRFGAEEIAIPLSASSRDGNIRNLRAMGLTNLTLNWLMDVAWRQDRNTLDISALNFGIKDKMSTALSGRLGNVTRDAFSTDSALAQVAWLATTAQNLKFSFTNLGLVERIIEEEAKKARKTPEALRREWGTMAAIGLPALLGSSDGARAISAAIARFLARPGSIEIEATSKTPAGLGIADIIVAADDLQSLFDKLDIRANAQ